MLTALREEKVETWFDLGLFLDRLREERPAPARPAPVANQVSSVSSGWPTSSRARRAMASAEDEMATVFNLGIGMVVAVPADAAGDALDVLEQHGHRAVVIGDLGPGSGQVHLSASR